MFAHVFACVCICVYAYVCAMCAFECMCAWYVCVHMCMHSISTIEVNFGVNGPINFLQMLHETC